MNKIYITSEGDLSPVLNEAVVEVVLSKYHKDMPDYGYGKLSHNISPIHKLFAFLEQENSDLGLVITHEIFYAIYFGDYTAEDILTYLEETKQDLSLNSLQNFINLTYKDLSKNYKKRVVFNAIYPYIFSSLFTECTGGSIAKDFIPSFLIDSG
jgi:hypothetical protein